MMRYNNEKIRRQDRLLEESSAIELLKDVEYGVLSLFDTDQGVPYAIPVNYAWNGKNSLYIHCAPEGRKLRCIKKNADISFCVVGKTHLLPSQFTTEYESIVMTGTAHVHLNDEEKHQALVLLLEKLSPNDMTTGLKYTEKSFQRVDIIRLDITEWSGKCKRVRCTG